MSRARPPGHIISVPVAAVLEYVVIVGHRMRHHFVDDRANVFGSGWQCPLGRRRYGGLCARIDSVVECVDLGFVFLDHSSAAHSALRGVQERL